MPILKKIQDVNKVLHQADNHILNFRSHSKLACAKNCGHCCIKTDISATILEFLPGAYHMYTSGQCDTILKRIALNKNNQCVFYTPFSNGGFCSHYHDRGLICRLFGYSAKTDKYGNRILSTCKSIKNLIENNKLQVDLALAPEMSDYYMELFGIDPQLSIQYFPINEAIKKAIEIVSLHFQYEKTTA